jgi:uncharacterized repeat protein (TIGR01451 family)
MGAFEVVPEADLALTLHASPSPVRLGSALTYTALVTNHGPQTAPNAGLTEVLPLTVTVASITATQGTCTPAAEPFCEFGDLAPGAAVTVSLVVTPTAAGWLSNWVVVGADRFDPALTNNSTQVDTLAVRPLFLPLVRR